MTVSGRYVITPATAIDATSLAMNPLYFDNRLVSVSDSYQYFRFTKLKAVTMNAVVENDGDDHCMAFAYCYGVPGVIPSTYQTLANCPFFAAGSGKPGSPWPKLSVLGKLLTDGDPVRWFRRGTAYDDNLEVQGLFIICAGHTFDYVKPVIVVEYEVILIDPLDPSDTSQQGATIPVRQLRVGELMRKREEATQVLAKVKDTLTELADESKVDLAPLLRASGMVPEAEHEYVQIQTGLSHQSSGSGLTATALAGVECPVPHLPVVQPKLTQQLSLPFSRKDSRPG